MANFSPLTVFISVTSLAVFQFLFHVGSSWLSTRLTGGFHKLSARQKIEWNSRTVSSFHALVVGCFCLYILVYDDAVNADPVWGDPFMVKLNVAVTSGYLISDLLLIIYYWKEIGDKYFVTHHLAALYAYYYVLVVFRSFGIFQIFSPKHGKWCSDDNLLLHCENSGHTDLLWACLFHLRHGGVSQTGTWCPVRMDHLKCITGYYERYVDDKNCKRVLQSPLSQRWEIDQNTE
ncbi:TLC domain-containing protein 4-B isoform X2 [Xenopus laevis]|uniref:TLC domain-containing protein 4-B isoform X2 n=1 Tax=Xenopus laevis TaxID=8355 RepID=A0A8J0V3A5_XENLA|nr:TLC domain-containing protein 4-B isoform X2 [Xenopus laevis]